MKPDSQKPDRKQAPLPPKHEIMPAATTEGGVGELAVHPTRSLEGHSGACPPWPCKAPWPVGHWPLGCC